MYKKVVLFLLLFIANNIYSQDIDIIDICTSYLGKPISKELIKRSENAYSIYDIVEETDIILLAEENIITGSAFGINFLDIVRANDYYLSIKDKLLNNYYIYTGTNESGDEIWRKNKYMAQFPKCQLIDKEPYGVGYSVGLYFKLYDTDFIEYKKTLFNIEFTDFLNKYVYLINKKIPVEYLSKITDSGGFEIGDGFIDNGDTFISISVGTDQNYVINKVSFQIATNELNITRDFYRMVSNNQNNEIKYDTSDNNYVYAKYNNYNLKYTKDNVVINMLKDYNLCLIELAITM